MKTITIFPFLLVLALCGCHQTQQRPQLSPERLAEIYDAVAYQSWLGPDGKPPQIPSNRRSTVLAIRPWPDHQFFSEFLPTATNATKLVAGMDAYLDYRPYRTVHMPLSLWNELEQFWKAHPMTSTNDERWLLRYTQQRAAPLPRAPQPGHSEGAP